MKKNNKVTKSLISFTNEDIESFSLASHDTSPLHTDNCYAQKTEYKECLVFGFLGCLASLGQIKNGTDKYLNEIEVKFRNPMYLNKSYSLDMGDHNIEVTDKDNTYISIKTSYEKEKVENKQQKEDIIFEQATHHIDTIQKVSLDYSEEELINGVVKTGSYATDHTYVKKVKEDYISPDNVLKPIHIDSLMMCSYIAGMVLPGRRSLCMKLKMKFIEAETYNHGKLEYKVTTVSYDKNFGVLSMDIKIFYLGQLLAYGDFNVCVRKENWMIETTAEKPVKEEKIAIAATFTEEPIIRSMNFWKKELNLTTDIMFAPYNQVFQELLDPKSLFSGNIYGMNVVMVRFEDWLRYRESEMIETYGETSKITPEDKAFLKETLDNLISALQSFSRSSNVLTLVLICPSSMEFKPYKYKKMVFRILEKQLEDAFKDSALIDVINAKAYHIQYHVEDIFESLSNKMGHVPFTLEYYDFLGTLINRRFYQLKNKPYKVIVLDCDNTLWRGVCGEAGAENVQVDGGFYELQNFLVRQINQGKLLCLCSKNNEQDVWAVFNENKSMLLKAKDITDSRINWKPKSDNVKSLASALNIGLDSFIFIDDNPVECADVRANCQEVFTIQWPQDTEEQVKLLNHFWILDQYSITEEDKIRTSLYKANAERALLKEVSIDYKDFIQSLNLNIKISQMTAEQISRVSQLTERTNQFNFTTIRRNTNEIQQIFESKTMECLTVDVEDKFGSYGLVGVMITNVEEDQLSVDTFLLSCRVLGRGVEHKMIAYLGDYAKDKDIETVKINLKKTNRNEPARQFLDKIGHSYNILDNEQLTSYIIPSKALSIVSMDFGTCPNKISHKAARTDNQPNQRLTVSTREYEKELERIYKELSDLSMISKEVKCFSSEAKKENSIIQDKRQYNGYSIRQQILKDIKLIFSDHLNIMYKAISGDDNLEQYAIDSFKIIEIMVSLTNAYGELPPTLLFEQTNLNGIVDYLLENNKEAIIRKYPSYDTINEVAVNKQSGDIQNVMDINNETQTVSQLTPSQDEDIAIIGINGLYPDAKTTNELWHILLNGESCIKEIPKDRWDLGSIFDPSGNRPDKTYSKWGAFIEDIAKFEPGFFNITPKEAELMDPQQRLFLQVVWGLLEDAGYTLDNIDRNTGVFAAVVASDYGTLSDQASLIGISAYRDTDFYQIPNRISYFFNFNGPSLAINTACSGSGTAVHLAYESLKRKECNTAIVGGINLFIHPSRWIQYAQIHFHSPDGVCRPFGEGANGTVFGEGVGALLLKRLKDAKRDNDHIYGIIRGSAINSGGKTNGFTVPNPKAQADLISKVLTNSDVDPKTISYIEAHGTGTSLGDPIEIRGLSMAFKESSKSSTPELGSQYCSLGSIKANIGHSESAAAISGMIKILLQMKYETLVPSLNATETNPKIEFNKTPFFIQQSANKWERPIVLEDGEQKTYPLRAGISSFGAGGSNSHVILEEYANNVNKDEVQHLPQLIVLSSKNESKLKEQCAKLLAFLEENMVSENEARDGNITINLQQIAYTLQVGRYAMEERVAFLASEMTELIQSLNAVIRGQNRENIYRGNIKNVGNIVKQLYDEESEEFIDLLIRERKLHKLAQLWCLGVGMDWNLFYTNNPGRVPLPGYSFEGERYWISGADIQYPVTTTISNSANIYSLTDCDACVVKESIFSQEENDKSNYNNNFNEKGHSEVTYYQFDYIESELLQDDDTQFNSSVLLFDNNRELYHALKDKLGQLHPIILVQPNTTFSENGDGSFGLDFSNQEDYDALIKALNGKVPCKIIYKPSDNETEKSMDRQLEMNFNSLLYLSQALMKATTGEAITLLFMYMCDNNIPEPAHSAISCFAKTIHQENPKFQYKTLEFNHHKDDQIDSTWLIEQLLKELNCKDKPVEIRYSNHKRWIKVYKKIVEDVNDKENKILKTNGVYLITGGLGGLGLIFAKYLAKEFKARLILTGRSELNSEKQEKINALEALGSKIAYIKADISNEEDVKKLIGQAKAVFNEINGVIHGAGILLSDFILNKKAEDVKAVFAPKVRGTLLLDEATQSEELDFFVFFSSISAPMGSVGYCDYATANTFMDVYALKRAQLVSKGMGHGLSLAIAWPFWDKGGMRLSDWSINNLKNTIGMIPLQTESGIQAFLDGLAMNKTNLVVIQGEEEKGQYAFEYNQIPKIKVKGELETLREPVDQEKLKLATEHFLKDLLADETKIPVNDIDEKEGLESYGIDSIMIMSLTGQLEKHFGSLSKTLFFEYQTIEKLAEHFCGHYKEVLVDLLGLRPSKSISTENKNVSLITSDERLKEHKTIDRLKENKQVSENYGLPDIAIIGVSGRYPDADNMDEFWDNLKKGKDSVTEIPKERWDYTLHFDPEKGTEGKSYSKWGAFLKDVDKFDPLFFNISPKEAKIMDPQERLFLQCAWQTFEDAGYNRASVEGTSIGVFAGVTWGEYQLYGLQETMTGRPISTSSIYASVANRVSYIFNFHGPSIAIDTMCASSLTAIHMACESIYSGECHMALAGGVNVSLHPNKYLYLSQGRFASSDGKCKAFGVGGDGYVPGEGVGTVLLKPLAQAEHDGDHIYAVIKSTSINHGGKTNGYTVPNPNLQAELVIKALKKANINPRTISYVEAHGTGTALGDPIEIKGLTNAFKAFTDDQQFCSIGSSKSNIGHLESAAGIAGLTKILLQMKYKMLAPSIHTDILNPNIDFSTTPFYVQRELAEWKNSSSSPKRAAVSSFGAGGSNSHIILEEYPSKTEYQDATLEEDYVIVLSAKNKERLAIYAQEISAFLDKNENASLRDIAYTLQVGREAMEERMALTVSNISELQALLKGYIDKKGNSEIFEGNTKKDKDKTKLLISGQAGEAFINQIIENRELSRLAGLWVLGINIDWNLLYTTSKPRRISLPTYPFARERYWAAVNNDMKVISEQKPSFQKLHPLLDRNTSTFIEQKFTTQLLGSEFYLRDHIINDEKLLPGVAYIEMARAAAELAGERSVKAIKDIVWLKPVLIGQEPREISICLYPDHHTARYEIASLSDGHIKIIHGQGTVEFEDKQKDGNINSKMDIESLINNCTEYITQQDYYKKLKALGYHYGPSFQGVYEIHKKNKEAIAQLKLPEIHDEMSSDLQLHPTLLDGALHPILSLMEEHDIGNGKIHLPFMIERIELYKPLESNCFAYVKEEMPTTDRSDIKKYHVMILNKDGEILVKIHSFTTKAISIYGSKNNSDTEILNIFQKLAQGELDLNQVESMMRRYEYVQ